MINSLFNWFIFGYPKNILHVGQKSKISMKAKVDKNHALYISTDSSNHQFSTNRWKYKLNKYLFIKNSIFSKLANYYIVPYIRS